MSDNIVFYLVFLCQVILISYYYPNKILNRAKLMVEKYPPSSYPKLYPVSIEKIERGQRNYRNMNAVIFIAGILLVIVGILTNYDVASNWDGLITLFFIIQFSPMLISEMLGFKYFKMMRKANSGAIRKAELRPRRFFDFVSPVLFGTAIFIYIAFILFALSAYPNQIHLGGKPINLIITITIGNLFFAGIILWNIYGKKQNPFQANKDRNRQISLTVKSLLLISIVATLFLMISVIVDYYYLDHLMPTILCLYHILLAVISFQLATPILQIENTDFEVYKEDSVAN